MDFFIKLFGEHPMAHLLNAARVNFDPFLIFK